MIELGDVATTVDGHGDSALHGSVMRGSKELTLFLLKQGAELGRVNECGWTPLTIAPRRVLWESAGGVFQN